MLWLLLLTMLSLAVFARYSVALPPPSYTSSINSTFLVPLQGVRPAALAKVPTEELSDFIRVCISARESRPRARSLLKHSYFDSIRNEKCAVKLSAEALLG